MEFSLINNDTEYEVYGIGTCTDTKIYIPREYNGKPVTKISNYAFQKCFSLTSITIPNSVTIIGPSAFEDCSNLTSITIPDSVTSIGYAAFSGTQVIKIECGVSYVGKWLVECDTSVTSVKIKDGTVGIANYAFYNCSSLTSITIPDGVTSIGNDVFYNCTSLTSITIPDSVTSIGKNAFKDCKNLKDIYFTGTEEEWIAIGKGKDWNYNTGNYTIHYNYVP